MTNKYPPINPRFPHFLHGGDYNPDQWPEEVWDEDMRLMKLANCNAMSVGIFAWTKLEPDEGRFEFGWLDNVMDLLAANGGYAVLATPSGARPAWLSQKYPEVLRVRPDRARNLHGTRHNHCFTSPVYREKVGIDQPQAGRALQGPPGAAGLAHLQRVQRRVPLRPVPGRLPRPGSRRNTTRPRRAQPGLVGRLLEPHLHRLGADRIAQPDRRAAAARPQPGLEALRHRPDDRLLQARDRPAARAHPQRAGHHQLDGHLPRPELPQIRRIRGRGQLGQLPGLAHHRLRLAPGRADRLRPRPQPLAEGRQALHADGVDPSNTNWQPVPKLKRPGMHMLSSLQAVAHGSDTVQYFQWRKSRGSSEKFHGAVVDHVGHEHTRVFGDVAELGAMLKQLDPVVGTTRPPGRGDLPRLGEPLGDRRYARAGPRPAQLPRDGHRPLPPFWKRGIPVDVIARKPRFSSYKLVVAPMLYMLQPGVAERLRAFVEKGGTLVATYWSGIVDENDLCFLGGWPGGGLREVLGIWDEEIDTLAPSEAQPGGAGRGQRAGPERQLRGPRLLRPDPRRERARAGDLRQRFLRRPPGADGQRLRPRPGLLRRLAQRRSASWTISSANWPRS